MSKKKINVLLVFAFIVSYIVIFSSSAWLVAFSFWGTDIGVISKFISSVVAYTNILLQLLTLVFLLAIGYVNKFQSKLVWKLLVVSLLITISINVYKTATNRNKPIFRDRPGYDDTIVKAKPLEIEKLGTLGEPTFKFANNYGATVNIPVTSKSYDNFDKIADSISGSWNLERFTTNIPNCSGLEPPTSMHESGSSGYSITLNFHLTKIESGTCTSEQVRSFLNDKPFYLLNNGNIIKEYNTKFE